MLTYLRIGRWFGLAMATGIVLVVGVACSAVSEPETVFVPVDAAVGDTSSDAASDVSSFLHDAGACEPGAVSTYQPMFHPASGAWQGLCEDGLIEQYYASCLGTNADNDQCSAFKAMNKDCAACIVTPDTASQYGPIIDHGTFVTANVAGCIELVADGTASDAGAADLLACARAVQAQAGCELAAC